MTPLNQAEKSMTPLKKFDPPSPLVNFKSLKSFISPPLWLIQCTKQHFLINFSFFLNFSFFCVSAITCTDIRTDRPANAINDPVCNKDGTAWGTTCDYTDVCDPATHFLHGDSMLTCIADGNNAVGKWNWPKPTCELSKREFTQSAFWGKTLQFQLRWVRLIRPTPRRMLILAPYGAKISILRGVGLQLYKNPI